MLPLRRPTRRLFPLTAAGALALAAVLVPATATASEPTRAGGLLPAAVGDVEIDLVGINDFHGRIEATGGSSAVAGAALLAGVVDEYRTANPNTIFVSAGDNIGASTFTSFVAKDTPTIEALNAAGLDVSALGNHEFDRGRTDLDTRVIDTEADFPYIAANLYEDGTTTPAYDQYWVKNVGGIDVGFIGAVTAALPTLVTPAGISTLDVGPIVPAVNQVAAELSDGNPGNGEADVIVLLVHEGPELGTNVAGDELFGPLISGLSTQIDAVFSGHTHQRFVYEQPVVGWADGLTRPVIQAGQYGQHLGHITLVVNAAGDVVSNDAEIVPLVGATATPDPDVAKIVSDAVTAAADLGAVSLGTISAAFNRARSTTGTENRGGESTLGNLVADVQLWATQDLDTDLAFMNPGGLRADLAYASTGASDPDGNVTYQEAATVQPFANTLVTMTLTGAEVVTVLEQQWQPAASRFLKLGVAGLTYTYDPTAPDGSHITEVWVAGQPIDLTAQYKVVVNSFLASGGDNFAAFAGGASKADSGRIDLQAFVDYLAAHSGATPDLAQRAVGVHLDDVPLGGFLPGDSVTVHLSSLLFSAGEVQGPNVTLSIDGTVVATEAIDPTIIDASDEVGRATVTFDVPAGTTGDLEVVVAVPGTDTMTSFVVPVLGDFPDVPTWHPFYEEILWLAQNGITTGYADGTFRGTAAVTRGAMAAFLYRATHGGETAPACTVAPFTDVRVGDPFCGEIAWLADSGITNGYADGTYRATSPVSRGAMAAFTYRLVDDIKGGVDLPACTAKPFTDVNVGDPFCAEIQWLETNDLSTGYPDGTYRATASITRQAMAAFLFRLAAGGFLDSPPL